MFPQPPAKKMSALKLTNLEVRDGETKLFFSFKFMKKGVCLSQTLRMSTRHKG